MLLILRPGFLFVWSKIHLDLSRCLFIQNRCIWIHHFSNTSELLLAWRWNQNNCLYNTIYDQCVKFYENKEVHRNTHSTHPVAASQTIAPACCLHSLQPQPTAQKWPQHNPQATRHLVKKLFLLCRACNIPSTNPSKRKRSNKFKPKWLCGK